MPLRYQLDVPGKRVYATGSEPFSDDDLRQYQLDLSTDPDHGDGFDQLIDLRDVGGLSVTAAGVRAAGHLSERFADHVVDTRCAVVATSILVYGMGRMFQALASSSVDVQVFRGMEEAERWLGPGRTGSADSLGAGHARSGTT